MNKNYRDNVLQKISRKLPYFNPALKKIGEYIIKNPEESKILTIKDLSMRCHVAESTITRFVKEMGYSNYREMKIALVEFLISSGIDEAEDKGKKDDQYIYEDITASDSTGIIIEKVVQRNIQTIKETKEIIDIEAIEKAAEMIRISDTIIFSCMGSSSLAAVEGVMRFVRSGKKCILTSDESMQLMSAAIGSSKDLVIGISNSGRTTSVISSLKFAKENGASTIGITSFDGSPICEYSDLILYTSTRSSDQGSALYWEATTSKTAQILIIDMLYAVYAANNIENTLDNLSKTYKALKHTRKDNDKDEI